jgi:hypothetical protein
MRPHGGSTLAKTTLTNVGGDGRGDKGNDDKKIPATSMKITTWVTTTTKKQPKRLAGSEKMAVNTGTNKVSDHDDNEIQSDLSRWLE